MFREKSSKGVYFYTGSEFSLVPIQTNGGVARAADQNEDDWGNEFVHWIEEQIGGASKRGKAPRPEHDFHVQEHHAWKHFDTNKII